MNLIEELDRSFGDGPAHRPVEQTVAAGRRLVVRRRLAAGAGATLAAVLVGGTAFALAGGGGPTAEPEPDFATTPTSSPTPEAAYPPGDAGGPAQDFEWGAEAAYLDTDGTLQIKPGWTIAEQIDEPVGPGSLAVEVAHDGTRQWFLWDGAGAEVVALGRPGDTGTPDSDYASFAGWVNAVSNHTPQPNSEGRR
jgi:hypothetical protein